MCSHDFQLSPQTRRRTFEIGQRGGGGVNSSKKEWGVGEMEFEAQMRMLDNSVSHTSLICFAFFPCNFVCLNIDDFLQGYRTGFAYVQPLERKEPARLASDVELPPTSSNLGWLMEEDELYKDSPLRGLLAQMARSGKGDKKVNIMVI